jgi:hypothetical protein
MAFAAWVNGSLQPAVRCQEGSKRRNLADTTRLRRHGQDAHKTRHAQDRPTPPANANPFDLATPLTPRTSAAGLWSDRSRRHTYPFRAARDQPKARSLLRPGSPLPGGRMAGHFFIEPWSAHLAWRRRRSVARHRCRCMWRTAWVLELVVRWLRSVLGALFKLLAEPFEILRGGPSLVERTCTCCLLAKPRPYLGAKPSGVRKARCGG